MPIKTFRALLTDGQQERIRLEHRDGKTGYRIKKLQTMPNVTAHANVSMTMKIYSVFQDAIDNVIDFSEQTLLGVAIFNTATATNDAFYLSTVFDAMTFNQDIFVTYTETTGNASGNYYLELEQISLDDTEATAVILKNFRNTNTVA